MLSWADRSFLPVRLARAIAASICLRSARVSLRRGLVCGSAGSACRFVFAANNVIHLLVEICLPLQHGIEVVGAVGALLGPADGHLEAVADDLFQGLAVFFIHRQHEKGNMTSIMHMAATLLPAAPRSKNKSGTPTSAPPPPQT